MGALFERAGVVDAKRDVTESRGRDEQIASGGAVEAEPAGALQFQPDDPAVGIQLRRSPKGVDRQSREEQITPSHHSS